MYHGLDLSKLKGKCTHKLRWWATTDNQGRIRHSFKRHEPLPMNKKNGIFASKATSAYPYEMNKRLVNALISAPITTKGHRDPSHSVPYKDLTSKTTVSRPLAKPMEPTIKQIREQENNSAQGGMRCPHRSPCVNEPRAKAVGKELRKAILRSHRGNTTLLEQSIDMLHGKPSNTNPQLPAAGWCC